MPDLPAVTVLHISDTQFGEHHRFDTDAADSLSGHLVRDLKRLAGLGVPPIDLIVLSGDIAETGRWKEYEQARAFVDEILRHTDLPPERVIPVPGNHDVSWSLCRAYFAECDDEGVPPRVPYPKKWRNYRRFVEGLHGPTAFTEEQPYRLHRFDELGVVVAAMNSTMEESHDDHYGRCGTEQLRWFAERLAEVPDAVRIAVVHHNVRRRAIADNENLRDEDDLVHIVGDSIDLLLHGHTHQGKEDRLSDGTLVLATGSVAVTADWRPGEVPNQYQILQLRPGGVTRWAQQWDGERRDWIADPRASRDGRTWPVTLDQPTPGWRDRGSGKPRPQPEVLAAAQQLLAHGFAIEVARVTRRDLGEVDIERRHRGSPPLDYLVAFPSAAPMRCVGIVDGTLDAVALDRFDAEVFQPLRPRGPALLVVHHGPDDPQLRRDAARRGIKVKTWNEYNDLLELSAYRSWLQRELDADPLYPQPLYQPQRFRDIDRFGKAGSQARTDLLDEVYDAVLTEDSRFLLILGDAGYGKSFLVRRLAYQLLGNPQAGVTPIVIYLRDRDKRETIGEMVARVLIPSRATFHADRFQHSLEHGTLALLVDGYDEFAVRVGYANAAAQLRTFVDAMRGRAKVLLTTRPNHFRSTDEVTTKLFEMLQTVHDGRVYQVEPFTGDQQRAFLTRWFELRGEADPPGTAGRWMDALAGVDNLPELARSPRMLSFIAKDLALDELHAATGQGTVTAADLYQRLVDRWLEEEASKSIRHDQRTVSPSQRQRLLEDLALELWRIGERDVTEDLLQRLAREALDLPELDLTADQAAQLVGGRTLLHVDGYRWRFAHQSVWEFLLASRLAGILRGGGDDDRLGVAELTPLTARFLRDLAPQEAEDWVARVAGGGS